MLDIGSMVANGKNTTIAKVGKVFARFASEMLIDG